MNSIAMQCMSLRNSINSFRASNSSTWKGFDFFLKYLMTYFMNSMAMQCIDLRKNINSSPTSDSNTWKGFDFFPKYLMTYLYE